MKLKLQFGALRAPLAEQLTAAGVTCDPGDDASRWQEFADAIALLSIHSLITDGETHRARRRLLMLIKQGVKPA